MRCLHTLAMVTARFTVMRPRVLAAVRPWAFWKKAKSSKKKSTEPEKPVSVAVKEWIRKQIDIGEVGKVCARLAGFLFGPP